ncbi:MT-A70-domain-containing protein [Xylaria bambusicola]|uniref:MT-A70-domain-containing protein n=1 Tax=Xylaria bambusicola TaxID=326684 RepID=UPI00200787DC|nr:MT-A70-domain-containing protein [Xylaria bambusicola]KAI0508561.1 MT-A70-domain-containing protein [Xylaria bambusicola]
MESSVLFKSPDGNAIVIDIPRSLEEAQVLPGQDITRRIVSAHPRDTPWQVPEPKKDTTQYVSPSAAIAELMTLESVKAALDAVKASYDGPWCLPRKQTGDVEPVRADVHADVSRKRKRELPSHPLDQSDETGPYIPERSHHLLGTVESRRDTFLQNAPQFDLIVLDPPWPSRSVKRKSNSYGIVKNMDEARGLLEQIPIAAHLKRDGLVAIWITNKAAVTDLLTSPGGILAQWGLEPVGEWIWLKITSTGEPISDVESAWRKPWERLLIARRTGSQISLPTSRRVMMGVPDIHSRKPNLRGLFEDILPKENVGLEVFARNLTAGWWSWGNEVLFFQRGHHWVEVDDGRDPLEDERDGD